MIKINLASVKETFEIGGKEFVADFSDVQLKKYFEYGQEVAEKDKEIAAKFPDVNEDADFGKVALAIAELLPKRAATFIEFFDKCFGEGKGIEIYKICGESTPNMMTVFQAVWQTIVSKMHNQEIEHAQEVADKYIKNKNKKK